MLSLEFLRQRTTAKSINKYVRGNNKPGMKEERALPHK
jgi:hypothetical protein